GLLVSRDARHVAFLVNMVPDTQRSLEQTPAFVQRVVDVFAAEGLDPDALHLGGQTATLGEVQTQMQRNVGVFLPAVAIFLIGTIYALFRRLWPAFVALAVGMIAIICPILLASIRTPKPWDPHGRRSLDAMLGAMRRVATRAPWPVIGVFAVFVVLSIYGTTRIEVETDLSKRMSAGSRFRRDTAYIDRHFAGTNALEVFVTPTTHGLDRNLSGRLARYHDALADLPDVGRVLSLVSVARSVGDAALLEPIPAAELMPALARLAAPELRPLVNGTDQLRFVVFITETGMARSYQIGLDADALAGTVFEGTAHVEVSGLAYLAGEWLDVNIRSQRTAVIVSFLAIAVVMVILFRSFGVGLWSMLPNLVPLLALGGIVGLAMDRTDSDLAMVALIAMGIAVDDTIHFLTRYRHETRRGGSRKEAIERTFGYAGRAIAMTSIIFAVGFAPFAFSGYLTIRLLGLLLPAVMVIAMLADLLLLPALLTVGAIRFSAPRPPEAR
ncbi:MAG: MMPL family transporter, partial [Planctomycetes bacterium]|nr:MMPL family transporter [Planctomycetota bacterium]